MPRGRAQRAEDFGRYDPTTHTLLIDHVERNKPPPGYPCPPIQVHVTERGRLHSVLTSGNQDVLDRAHNAGVPDTEPLSARHEHHRKFVERPEKFGRYDPIASSLAFRTADGNEHTIRVGDNGRLRSVLESGTVNASEAKAIGLPPPIPYKGRRPPLANPGHFNPLTHEYQVDASPRDVKRASGRNPGVLTGTSLSPRLNPVTQQVDKLNSTAASLRVYDSRLLEPVALQAVMRMPIPASPRRDRVATPR